MLWKNNTIKMSNSLEPDQAQHYVGYDLGPNCLHELSAADIAEKLKLFILVINMLKKTRK